MNSFTKLNLTYKTIIDASNEVLNEFFKIATRQEIINWLSWNDANGIYQDKQSKKEFGKILSKNEAIEIMRNQILSNK
jgi:neutral trehalase